jgi:hypothetical protein
LRQSFQQSIPFLREVGDMKRGVEKWLNDKYGDKSRARKWDYQPA